MNNRTSFYCIETFIDKGLRVEPISISSRKIKVPDWYYVSNGFKTFRWCPLKSSYYTREGKRRHGMFGLLREFGL